MTDAAEAPFVPKTRAVVRPILPAVGGLLAPECVHCDQLVKFRARVRKNQVIANIYRRRVWQRVEHFHAECYVEAGQPYGHLIDEEEDACVS